VKEYQKLIENLVSLHTSEKIKEIQSLPLTASNRMYYRVVLEDKATYIAVYNDNIRENEAFISYAASLLKSGNAVPEVFSVSTDKLWYLQSDLGHQTLYDFLQKDSELTDFENKRKAKYEAVIQDLQKIQIEAYPSIDFSKGFPRAAFDKQSIQWDLNYFKYYFLKLSGLNFDEQLLEDDFNKLTNRLLDIPSDFFMFRDFQSRNIMLDANKLYYIDFQGGRKGPLQYDLASLLFDAKANLPQTLRLELLDYYVSILPKHIQDNQSNFKTDFWLFAMVRIMQAMGAYGYRGLYEKKEHFIKSIPLALNNLQLVLKQIDEPQIGYLLELLQQLQEANGLRPYLPNKKKNQLKLKINSFSFKKGIPQDTSSHGGGFVFDCRAIHNPGRYDDYKTLTGKDKAVIDFFKTVPEMESFLSHVYDLVDASVSKYIERDFDSLMVNFGCTGGQHRSVFSAEKLKQHLEEKFDVDIELHHIEQEKK
jgi:aminoglycoside/choline kinase family phosphotransferase